MTWPEPSSATWSGTTTTPSPYAGPTAPAPGSQHRRNFGRPELISVGSHSRTAAQTCEQSGIPASRPGDDARTGARLPPGRPHHRVRRRSVHQGGEAAPERARLASERRGCLARRLRDTVRQAWCRRRAAGDSSYALCRASRSMSISVIRGAFLCTEGSLAPRGTRTRKHGTSKPRNGTPGQAGWYEDSLLQPISTRSSSWRS